MGALSRLVVLHYRILAGAHHPGGLARFVDPAHDNYHLGRHGAAIDQGVDLGVAVDYDGDVRPYGLGFDIGFDEAVPHFLYLPLVRR
jgi:hypothetical protein